MKRPSVKTVTSWISLHWSLAARLLGLALGSGELIAWMLGTQPSSGVMTFAAGLLVIPNVANAQKERNDRKGR